MAMGWIALSSNWRQPCADTPQPAGTGALTCRRFCPCVLLSDCSTYTPQRPLQIFRLVNNTINGDLYPVSRAGLQAVRIRS